MSITFDSKFVYIMGISGAYTHEEAREIAAELLKAVEAAQQSVQSDKCPHCQHGLIVLPDKSVIDCIACGSTGIRR